MAPEPCSACSTSLDICPSCAQPRCRQHLIDSARLVSVDQAVAQPMWTGPLGMTHYIKPGDVGTVIWHNLSAPALECIHRNGQVTRRFLPTEEPGAYASAFVAADGCDQCRDGKATAVAVAVSSERQRQAAEDKQRRAEAVAARQAREAAHYRNPRRLALVGEEERLQRRSAELPSRNLSRGSFFWALVGGCLLVMVIGPGMMALGMIKEGESGVPAYVISVGIGLVVWVVLAVRRSTQVGQWHQVVARLRDVEHDLQQFDKRLDDHD